MTMRLRKGFRMFQLLLEKVEEIRDGFEFLNKPNNHYLKIQIESLISLSLPV